MNYFYRVGCSSPEGGSTYVFTFPQKLNKRQLYALMEAALVLAAKNYLEEHDYCSMSPSVESLFYSDYDKTNRFIRAMKQLGFSRAKYTNQMFFNGWSRPHSKGFNDDADHHTKRLIKRLETICPLRYGDDNHPLTKHYIKLHDIKHKPMGKDVVELDCYTAQDVVGQLWDNRGWFTANEVAFMIAGVLKLDHDHTVPPSPSYPLARKLIKRLRDAEVVRYDSASRTYFWQVETSKER